MDNQVLSRSHLGGQRAAETHRRECRRFDSTVAAVVVSLRGRGWSLQRIADALSARGIRTRQGREKWDKRQVSRVLSRAMTVPCIALEDARLGIRR
jgi:hypothetical protein